MTASQVGYSGVIIFCCFYDCLSSGLLWGQLERMGVQPPDGTGGSKAKEWLAEEDTKTGKK